MRHHGFPSSSAARRHAPGHRAAGTPSARRPFPQERAQPIALSGTLGGELLGTVPAGGTATLVAAVGFPRAVDICATARWVDAAEALRIGLVQAVVPPGELAAAVDAFAAAVLAHPAAAVRATRSLLAGAATRERPEQLAAERSAQGDRLRALVREAPGR